jgi:lysophospholipase L1-like esterase
MPTPYRRAYIGDFDRSIREHPDWPVVVSEGDSWFSFSDVVGRLDDPQDQGNPKFQRAWCLLRLEKAGDEILTILSGAQRSKLRAYLGRWPLDAFLFSGGGNDIIGADFAPLLKPFVPGATAPDLVVQPRLDRRLRQIEDCYRELLDLMTDAGQPAKVFANSYDYVVPSKKGAVYVGPFKVAGPWLEPALTDRGIPQPLWPALIRLLIDAFATTLDRIAADPTTGGRLVRVETRNVVQGRYKDEIHPNRDGAKSVAKQFENALRGSAVLP